MLFEESLCGYAVINWLLTHRYLLLKLLTVMQKCDIHVSPQVEIVVPDCLLGNVIHCFQNISPTRDQFCFVKLPVHAFTEVEFIKTFIKNGKNTHNYMQYSNYVVSRKSLFSVSDPCLSIFVLVVILSYARAIFVWSVNKMPSAVCLVLILTCTKLAVIVFHFTAEIR